MKPHGRGCRRGKPPSCRGGPGGLPWEIVNFAPPEMHSGAFSVTRSVFW